MNFNGSIAGCHFFFNTEHTANKSHTTLQTVSEHDFIWCECWVCKQLIRVWMPDRFPPPPLISDIFIQNFNVWCINVLVYLYAHFNSFSVFVWIHCYRKISCCENVDLVARNSPLTIRNASTFYFSSNRKFIFHNILF